MSKKHNNCIVYAIMCLCYYQQTGHTRRLLFSI
jgi:hypothetical protein